jgi:CubicO group peptidase (beta-lactamase class C family)
MTRVSLCKHFITSLIIIFSTCSNTFANSSNKPDYWPTIGWRASTPEEQGFDSALLIEMLEKIIKDGVDINSISIIRNGYLIADIYMYPADKYEKHAIHSCTKSFTSTLVGIAVDKGYIESTQQHMVDFFPEKSIKNMDGRKSAITLQNLLTMRSGLETKDNMKDYRWQGLYEMRRTNDWTQYVLDRPMAEPPGTRFEYSNLVSFLLTSILQEQTKRDALSFAREHLFGPLGIKDVMWYKSPKGVYNGFAGLSLTPHNMAKLGFLYLNNGRWETQQILSEDWVEIATKGHASASWASVSASWALQYGYQWWVAEDFYFAMGYQGQFIFVVPDKHMVVVFTSDHLVGRSLFTPLKYLKEYILPAAISTKSLPVNHKNSQRMQKLTNDLFNKYYHDIQISP